MTHPRSENAKLADSAAVPGNVRAAQSERRRADIIKAAREVLAQGYAEFSLRKVAAAAGVRLNTVQHHFGDLDSLILSTIESSVEEFMQYSQQLAEGRYDCATDDLNVFLDDAWVLIRDVNVRNLYFEVWAMARHRPAVAELIERIYSDYLGALAPILRRINPDLTEAEARTTATLISCWTEGAIVMAHWGGPGMPSLGLLGIRMKAACLALVGTSHATPASATPHEAKPPKATDARRAVTRSKRP
jgi:AcrR family transcriptional regulator